MKSVIASRKMMTETKWSIDSPAKLHCPPLSKIHLNCAVHLLFSYNARRRGITEKRGAFPFHVVSKRCQRCGGDTDAYVTKSDFQNSTAIGIRTHCPPTCISFVR